ncbi:MAG: hypothetical protein ACO2ZE_08345 [Pseudohongiellaceae bacterium]
MKRILKNRLSALKRLMALTALLIGGCSTPGADQDANKLRELTILYTNDEPESAITNSISDWTSSKPEQRKPTFLISAQTPDGGRTG